MASVPAAEIEPVVTRDPLEAALLAEPIAAPRAAPQSDMNAVISSAMRFIETPVEDGEAVAAVETLPVDVPEESVAAVETPVDGEAEVRQAVQTALSVWP
ncbi:MAG: hypothetical protein JF615_01005, partial [Asticcacaulis sp.]|nr:hypothetical protein [Asticcacaulis sp.]